mgnify:CR=1 FL=1
MHMFPIHMLMNKKNIMILGFLLNLTDGQVNLILVGERIGVFGDQSASQ